MPPRTRRVANYAIATAFVLAAVVSCLFQTAVASAESAAPSPASGVTIPVGQILDRFGPAAEVTESAHADPGSVDPSNDQLAPEPGAGGGSEEQVIQRRAAPLGAARPNEKGQVVQRADRAASSWTLETAIPLAIVLGLIAAAALLVKRYLPARRLLTGAGVVDVIARMPLSGKQSLMAVKLGRQIVLLGVSPERINALAVVNDPEEVALLVGRAASGRPDSMTNAFAEAFRDESSAYTEGPATQDVVQAAGGQVRGLLDKVKSLSGR